jgi:hypothetical protein
MTLKAACHIHSEWSYDASWPLPELAKFFSKRGYQVLLMTEHDRGFCQTKLDDFKAACSKASTEEILLIPGIEYSDPTNTIHILTWGDIPFYGEDKETLPLLCHVAKHHGISVLAHPSRKSAWEKYDPTWTPFLNGIELWNRKTDGIRPSPQGVRMLSHHKLNSFLGLDFHSLKQTFPLSLELSLSSSNLEKNIILDAIRNGQYTPKALGLPFHTLNRFPINKVLSVSETFRRQFLKAVRKLYNYR